MSRKGGSWGLWEEWNAAPGPGVGSLSLVHPQHRVELERLAEELLEVAGSLSCIQRSIVLR